MKKCFGTKTKILIVSTLPLFTFQISRDSHGGSSMPWRQFLCTLQLSRMHSPLINGFQINCLPKCGWTLLKVRYFIFYFQIQASMLRLLSLRTKYRNPCLFFCCCLKYAKCKYLTAKYVCNHSQLPIWAPHQIFFLDAREITLIFKR